ncbi:hypothetical protein PFISCL1PPCAC_9423, partial [Pristionchus fissidentatus]
GAARGQSRVPVLDGVLCCFHEKTHDVHLAIESWCNLQFRPFPRSFRVVLQLQLLQWVTRFRTRESSVRNSTH